jgi:hypothetical protein
MIIIIVEILIRVFPLRKIKTKSEISFLNFCVDNGELDFSKYFDIREELEILKKLDSLPSKFFFKIYKKFIRQKPK